MLEKLHLVGFDGADDGKHNSDGLVESSEIFAMQDDCFPWGSTI